MAFTSRTTTKTTLTALKSAGWGVLCEPSQRNHGMTEPPEGFGSVMLDNGAWGCFKREEPFDEGAFLWMWRRFKDAADFVVLPDIVAGGAASLAFSLSWLPLLRDDSYRLLLPVQDGMVPTDVAHWLSPGVGLFVGGSTEWKLDTLRSWGGLAKRRRCWLHVARVNSARRIRLCQDAGVDSFDGTSPVLFPKTLRKLDNERKQGHLFGGR